MKHLLMLAIRLYWKIPSRLHNRCIFRETCSHYVYRIANEHGFYSGLKALKERYELCRPNYIVYKSLGHYYLKTANGSIVEEEDIAPSELPPYNNNILDLDNYNYIPKDKHNNI